MGFSGVWAILILSVRDGHCFASFQQLSMPTKPIMRSLPRDRWSFPVRRARRLSRETRHRWNRRKSNVKPAVGFTLPSAGLSPAPSINRRCGASPLLELLARRCWILLEAEVPDRTSPVIYGRGGRRAEAPVGEGSAIQAATEQGRSLFLLWLFCFSIGLEPHSISTQRTKKPRA